MGVRGLKWVIREATKWEKGTTPASRSQMGVRHLVTKRTEDKPLCLGERGMAISTGLCRLGERN